MRAFPQMMGLPVVLKSFDELAHSIRTGRPSIELSDPDGLWGYLSGAPAERAVFGRAMTARAAGDTAAVLAAHDFSSARRIVDVGGGRGHLLHAVLEATPRHEASSSTCLGSLRQEDRRIPGLSDRRATSSSTHSRPGTPIWSWMCSTIGPMPRPWPSWPRSGERQQTTPGCSSSRGSCPSTRPGQPVDRRHHARRHRWPGANRRRAGESPRRGWLTARAGHRHPRAAPDRRGAPREAGRRPDRVQPGLLTARGRVTNCETCGISPRFNQTSVGLINYFDEHPADDSPLDMSRSCASDERLGHLPPLTRSPSYRSPRSARTGGIPSIHHAADKA